MRIGVLFNCQHRGLARSLGTLLPQADIVSYELITARGAPETAARIAADLRSCDAVIGSGAGPIWAELSTESLTRTMRRLVVVPAVIFAGFHPDSINIAGPAGQLRSPTGMIHSRLAVAAYLAGLTPPEAASLYNRLVFRRLGYLGGLAQPISLLTQRFAHFGIDLAPYLARWRPAGCFMHSVIHPKIPVLADLARIACCKLDLATEAATATPEDDLACHATHPILPPLARTLGLAAEAGFKPFHAAGAAPAPLTTEQFVAASFALYAATPYETLSGADGVTQAIGHILQPA